MDGKACVNSHKNRGLYVWLTEDRDPAVSYRTRTEILRETADPSGVRVYLRSKLPENRHETKGLWYVYFLTAFAECGLTVKVNRWNAFSQLLFCFLEKDSYLWFKASLYVCFSDIRKIYARE